MKISIVTAAYNASQYLPDLINSIVGQTYPPFEHIIIDDGSTDNTPQILETYAQQHAFVRWWQHENQGQYPTLHQAIQAVSGDVLCIINADDKFASADVFETVANYWKQNPMSQILYGRTLRMDEDGNPLPNLDPHWKPSRWLIRHVSYIQHCSLFVSVPFLHQNALYFDLSLPTTGDWDWIIRLFHTAQHIGYSRHAFGVFRMHAKQMSRTGEDTSLQGRKTITQKHHSSFLISSLIRRLLIYRGMFLLGWDILRKKGMSAFIQRMRLWIKKRLSTIRHGS
ncbi:MAG: hypothetical protein Kow00117_22200 [Phototrophicales bacterium]